MPGQLANWDYQWSQVVGQAWADNGFKQRLLAEPATVLQEYGVAVPPGTRLQVVEGADAVPTFADNVVCLVLPARPSAADLSEEELLTGAGHPGLARCGCERCDCHRCHHCERCGCHHPEPDTDD